MRQVELESEASAKTDLYSSYVAAETRLSSFAQLSRTGRWCAQFAWQSAGGTACAGAWASCGTTSARNLAFGASTPWLAQRGSAHLAKGSYADTKRIRCSRGLGTSAASRCMNSSGDITRCGQRYSNLVTDFKLSGDTRATLVGISRLGHAGTPRSKASG